MQRQEHVRTVCPRNRRSCGGQDKLALGLEPYNGRAHSGQFGFELLCHCKVHGLLCCVADGSGVKLACSLAVAVAGVYHDDLSGKRRCRNIESQH